MSILVLDLEGVALRLMDEQARPHPELLSSSASFRWGQHSIMKGKPQWTEYLFALFNPEALAGLITEVFTRRQELIILSSGFWDRSILKPLAAQLHLAPELERQLLNSRFYYPQLESELRGEHVSKEDVLRLTLVDRLYNIIKHPSNKDCLGARYFVLLTNKEDEARELRCYQPVKRRPEQVRVFLLNPQADNDGLYYHIPFIVDEQKQQEQALAQQQSLRQMSEQQALKEEALRQQALRQRIGRIGERLFQLFSHAQQEPSPTPVQVEPTPLMLAAKPSEPHLPPAPVTPVKAPLPAESARREPRLTSTALAQHNQYFQAVQATRATTPRCSSQGLSRPRPLMFASAAPGCPRASAEPRSSRPVDTPSRFNSLSAASHFMKHDTPLKTTWRP